MKSRGKKRGNASDGLPHRAKQVKMSAGELENDEHTAGVIMQMVRTACRFRLQGAAEPPFKRMSVMLEDYVYTVTVSGQKVFVVKRQNNKREPVVV
ncbi:ragulator complex protein LAMTOR4 isoform X2 [Salmo salar]|uniref:Ragulator complex protein LAMTOR4 n=1 Tax=Salmo salar TaxID=8030 RepID=A0ABM3DA05_SALSA|nr:ragulator complex protein LAMTOR4 isoform X2 [Salmo salar]